MIANFNQRTDAAPSKAEIWNVQAQYHEAYRGSFVDRVCSFLEQYPLSTPTMKVLHRPAPVRPIRDRG
jgi:hypothetical protein